jgi:Domain of Unknown Function with PDB structure (DUF3857)/Transglutaminase-like superfamily
MTATKRNEGNEKVMPRIGASGFALLIAGLVLVQAARAADWMPIDSKELQMTSEPNAPGAAAVYLYRQVDRSDVYYSEKNYVRIKILSEEGLKYANVELPFDGQNEAINEIQARTVQPDGSSVQFDGKVFDKPIIEARGAKLLARTFTMPNVQVGSIIEYRYVHRLRYGWIYDSRWILSSELYTEHAKFYLEVAPQLSLRWSWPRGLPDGSVGPKKQGNIIQLEAHNIPAFVEEEHMPPADELRLRVDFIYDADMSTPSNLNDYWNSRGRRLYQNVQKFAVANRVMTQAVAQIIAPTDSTEEKVRKIYARVAQIHNLRYESDSQKEANQEKPESIHDAGDVWQKGYGDSLQITQLYLALVRAAGIDSDPVLIATRDRYFFNKSFMNAGQLNGNLVVVKVDGKDVYLDPGTPFTPFGLLPWWETAVEGLRLSKDASVWINTPVPGHADSRIERKASLKLDNGTLTGHLTVTYTGLEAAQRRLDLREQDETARKQFLEEDVERAIPVGINITLTNKPDWSGWDTPLVAEYDLQIPGWATPAGRRALLPVSLFGNQEKGMFAHTTRIQPLYFANSYQHTDDVTIALPAGWVVDSVPQARNVDLKRVAYRTTLEIDHQTLHLSRQFDFDLLIVDPKGYDTVRNFYQAVQTADEERAVLSPDPGPRAGH